MKKFKAFTLLETIVVIIVFCIGILAVLHGLSQTLRNKDYANTQIKSAFFAREGIELVFNLRDANYQKKLPRNCIFKYTDLNPDHEYAENEEPFCEGRFGSGVNNIFKISMGSGNDYISIQTGVIEPNFENNFQNYQIYFHTGDTIINNETGFIFDHDEGDGENGKTGFARYIVITGVVENGDTIDKDKLLKIESHVLYKRGGLTGEKVMETFIGNYEFKQ